MKTLDEGIEQSRNIIAKFDELFGYNAEEDTLEGFYHITDDEFQTLQEIKNIPAEKRLPWQQATYLELESRNRWGEGFKLWSNFDDDDIPF